MRATGMAALLARISALREITLRPTPQAASEWREAAIREVETIWSDISAVLSDEKRAEIERLDRWLTHIDEAMSSGGDIPKLIDQGRRVLDMRRELIALDVEAAAYPQPETEFLRIAQQALLDDQIDEEMRSGRKPAV